MMLGDDAVRAWSRRPRRRQAAIDWSRLRAADFDRAERAQLSATWTQRAYAEHDAMVVFAELASDLLALDARPELIGSVSRVVADEARHAQLCGQVALAFGAERDFLERAPKVRRSKRYPPRERVALVMVHSMCVAESWSAAVFARQLRGARHPVLRAVEKEILADEVTHGRLGFAWVHDSWMGLPMSTRLLVENTLPGVLHTLESRHSGDRLTLFGTVMQQKVLPELQKLRVRAVRAWNRRHE